MAVVVSESSVVRVFDDGELVAEIIPELWLFSKYVPRFDHYVERSDEHLKVVAKAQ